MHSTARYRLTAILGMAVLPTTDPPQNAHRIPDLLKIFFDPFLRFKRHRSRTPENIIENPVYQANYALLLGFRFRVILFRCYRLH
jgi:hypothetical protein